MWGGCWSIAQPIGARARGETSLYLFVFESNANARAFYAATGWREAGRRNAYHGDGADCARSAIGQENMKRAQWA